MRQFLIFACSLLSLYSVGHITAVQEGANADPFKETDKFAWQLFLSINRPVSDTDLFWETWARASDVFRDPKSRPTFPKYSAGTFTLFQPPRTKLSADQPDLNRIAATMEPRPPCVPEIIDSGEQIMMNEATVQFIADKGLFSIEGQIRRSRQEKISFPKDSVEVKANWRVITKGEADIYYSKKCGHTTYGLTALSITSKATDNWVWATFEHVKTGKDDQRNRDQCKFIRCRDTFGAFAPDATARTALEYQPSKALLDLLSRSGLSEKQQKLWLNYRLVGTQVYFTEGGTATHLGNSVFERNVGETSSCITCHSRATISDSQERLKISTPDGKSFDGERQNCWFEKDGNLTFRQLDFVWSLMLAKSEQGKKRTEFAPGSCDDKSMALKGSPQ